MATITCDRCRKPLRVKPEWAGQKAECPSCGHQMVLPQVGPRSAGRSPSSGRVPRRCPECGRAIKRGERECSQCGVDVVKAAQRIAAARATRPWGMTLPILGVRLGKPALLIIAALVVTSAALLSAVLNSPPVRVIDLRAVDVFEAMGGVSGDAPPLANPLNHQPSLTPGGAMSVVVTRDDPDGRFVLIRAEVRQSFLINHHAADESRLMLDASRLRVVAGPRDCPTWLIQSRCRQTASVKLAADAEVPLTAPGPHQALRHTGTIDAGDGSVLIDNWRRRAARADYAFHGERGMVVRCRRIEGARHVSWDSRSTGWLCGPSITAARAESDRHTWQFALLVELPAGGLSQLDLMMFDRVVARIDASEAPLASAANGR